VKTMNRAHSILGLNGCGAVAGGLGCAILLAAVTATVAGPDRQRFEQIERGRYLSSLADCGACHTRPDGPPFAGGVALQTPFGVIVAPNITPTSKPESGAGRTMSSSPRFMTAAVVTASISIRRCPIPPTPR